jgi:hypothetical protein
MVAWLEVFLMILFVVSLADAATRRSKSSPNFAGRRRAESEFHEWRGSDGPKYDQVATLEAAKQAFRAGWDRRPKASGNG